MMSREDFFNWARNGPYAHCSTELLYFAYEVYLTCPLSREPEHGISHADCGRCGNCCRRPWRIEVSLHDIRRWIDEGRFDILRALERKPRHRKAESAWGLSTDALQTAVKVVRRSEEQVAAALSIAYATVAGEDSYVLPKARGCKYLIDGERTLCAIYDTRPDVCKNFPSLEPA